MKCNLYDNGILLCTFSCVENIQIICTFQKISNQVKIAIISFYVYVYRELCRFLIVILVNCVRSLDDHLYIFMSFLILCGMICNDVSL